jgi:hypothetical protein
VRDVKIPVHARERLRVTRACASCMHGALRNRAELHEVGRRSRLTRSSGSGVATVVLPGSSTLASRQHCTVLVRGQRAETKGFLPVPRVSHHHCSYVVQAGIISRFVDQILIFIFSNLKSKYIKKLYRFSFTQKMRKTTEIRWLPTGKAISEFNSQRR